MSNPCPKCHYVRTSADATVHPDICPACGIVYHKWQARQPVDTQTDTQIDSETEIDAAIEITPRISLREQLLQVPEQIDSGSFWARAATFVGFCVWTYYFVSGGVDWERINGSFLHNINLPFHEFGHIFFRPFGRFMTILGGSLFQVLLPLGLLGAFLWKQRDTFAASLMLWWFGQNFIDLSPYISDAQYRMLPLVGGGGEESHDWGNLLTMMGVVEKSYRYGKVSFVIGAVIMLLALLWCLLVLYKQKQRLRQD